MNESNAEDDDAVWSRLYSGESDYAPDVKIPSVVNQFDQNAQYEDMSGTDSKSKEGSDSSMLSYITGWHPFLRFLYRTADMKYAFIMNPRQRAYRFITSHKITFWICFWADWIIVLIGSAGMVGLAVIAVVKTLGLL